MGRLIHGRPKHIWGKTTDVVEDILKKDELGDPRSSAANGHRRRRKRSAAALISMANQTNRSHRHGRGHGQQNLKAVAVRQRPAQGLRQQGLNALAKSGAKEFPESDAYGTGVLGTAEIVLSQNAVGGLATLTGPAASSKDTRPSAATACRRRSQRARHLLRLHGALQTRSRGHRGSIHRRSALRRAGIRDAGDLRRIAASTIWQRSSSVNQLLRPVWDRHHLLRRDIPCLGHGPLRAGADHDRGHRRVELRFGNAAAMVQMVEQIARRGDLAICWPTAPPGCRADWRGTEELVVSVKKLGDAGPHAARQALTGADLRRQPVRRGSPIQRARSRLPPTPERGRRRSA